ncbi:26316_t:CDS:2, partial [Dentiscutata erythropus]
MSIKDILSNDDSNEKYDSESATTESNKSSETQTLYTINPEILTRLYTNQSKEFIVNTMKPKAKQARKSLRLIISNLKQSQRMSQAISLGIPK